MEATITISTGKNFLSRTRVTRAVLIAATLLTLSLVQSARADTYTYTGAPFSYNGSAYALTGVSGSFTVPFTLASNTTYILAPNTVGGAITGYSFTDGHTTWNLGNFVAGPDSFGSISKFSLTTGNGDIVSWDFNIVSSVGANLPYPNSTQGVINFSWNGTTGTDGTNVYNNYDAYNCRPTQNIYCSDTGLGTWSGNVTASVPEPSSVLQLLTGLLGVGTMVLRRKPISS
jgi:hypothetical protein